MIKIEKFKNKLNRKKYGKIKPMDDIISYREFKTDDDATQWGTHYYSQWSIKYKKTISLSTRITDGSITDYISGYCGFMYRNINSYLRFNDGKPQYREMTDMLILCGCSAPVIPENVILYRIVCDEFINQMILLNKEKGIPIQEKGFMSTSLVKDVIINNNEFSNYSNLLKIYVPKGTLGFYVNVITKRNEQEMLLLPGNFLRLIKYPHECFDKESKKYQVYECELISFDS